MRNVNKIYFSPDKELYYIPIEYAETPEGMMISEKYQIFRLSSTKEIATKREPRKSKCNDITIFGNIDYDNSKRNRATKTPIENVHNNTKFDSIPTNIKRGASEYNSKIYSHLDASKPEIYSIASLSISKGLDVTIFEEDNASESAFRSMSGNSPDILIVSTHGFFEPENIDQTKERINNNVLPEDAILTHTGLVFAGANTTLLDEREQSYKPVEDGLVTSQELSLLNLNNTNLAILSACETGLGVSSEDGIMGLQRGFKKAGVGSLLMSLWKVEDDATCKLMTEFFSNWIGKKMTKYDALEGAKRTVRETKGWEDPKYWAAFILLDGLD